MLKGFLLTQPMNAPLQLAHYQISYTNIQRDVEAHFCNITNEHGKDLFWALDLVYYLHDIPRPKGPGDAIFAFDKHSVVKFLLFPESRSWPSRM